MTDSARAAEIWFTDPSLPDLLEARIRWREEGQRITEQIGDAVKIEHKNGMSIPDLAQLLGVTEARIRQLVRIGF